MRGVCERSSEAVKWALCVAGFAFGCDEGVNAPPPEVEWTVGEAPVLEIKSPPSGEFALSWIAAASWLPSGEIAVANADAGQILLFAPDGSLVKSMGRSGQGPGEFTWLSGVEVIGDSLLLSDSQTQRVTVLDQAGGVVRTVSFGPEPDMRIGRVHAVSDTLWAVQGFPAQYPGDPGTLRQSPVAFGYTSPVSSEWRKVAEVPGMMMASAMVMGRFHIRPAAFTPTPVADVLGTCWVVGSGERRLSIVAPSGDTIRVLEVDIPTRATTQEDYDAWAARNLERLEGPAAEFQRRFLAEIRYPPEFPAIKSIVVDNVGLLWVQEWQKLMGPSPRWRVLDPNTGQQVAKVEMPFDWSILDIQESRILALGLTELDERYLVEFDLSRPDGTNPTIPRGCRSEL